MTKKSKLFQSCDKKNPSCFKVVTKKSKLFQSCDKKIQVVSKLRHKKSKLFQSCDKKSKLFQSCDKKIQVVSKLRQVTLKSCQSWSLLIIVKKFQPQRASLQRIIIMILSPRIEQSYKYTHADWKICQYLRLHVKVIQSYQSY